MQTTLENIRREAAENLRRLSENPYPGRGIILGRSADGERLVQVYWIMGRSENSRNRVIVARGGLVRTEPIDLAKVEHPRLVIYTAMRELPGQYFVSNGDQTDIMVEAIESGGTYQEGLRECTHEPDEPNWTPRIAGAFQVEPGRVRAFLAIIRADRFDTARSTRFFYEYEEPPPGFGVCITTYRGNGTPLPPFQGEPLLLPLAGETGELGNMLWNRLNEKNRISLAVKLINPADGESTVTVINKFAKRPGSR